MTLAIMQPYLFPYIGYFQLMHAADRFVVYDDVNYMKQGWVNRNRILVSGAPHLFTMPIAEASAYARINQLALHGTTYPKWRGKFIATIRQAYARAPFRDTVLEVVEQVLPPGPTTLQATLLNGLRHVQAYIGATSVLIPSSQPYGNAQLGGTDRVLDICKYEGASTYVNAIGGKTLYDKANFKAHGIDLFFLRSRPIEYRQGKHNFVPNLSILDVMMWNAPEQIKEWLGEYDLE